MPNSFSTETEGAALVAARGRVMALAARATPDELAAALEALGRPEWTDVRRPETGLVMLRGRTGGDGAPFNFGEATVTRAAVRVACDGPVGLSYILGRDIARARAAATIDALWQSGRHDDVEAVLLAPVRARLAAEDAATAARTAATRVDFFTMVRGED